MYKNIFATLLILVLGFCWGYLAHRNNYFPRQLIKKTFSPKAKKHISYRNYDLRKWYAYDNWKKHKRLFKEYSLLKTHNERILLLGDSLFSTMPNNHYFPNSTNLSVSGMGTMLLFEEIGFIDEFKSEVVLLYVGGNDLDEGVNYQEAFEYYKKIVDYLIGKGKRVLCLAIHKQFEGRKRNEDLDKYNSLIKELSNDRNLVFIPSPDKLYDDKGYMKPEYAQDGEHFNFDGFKIWTDEIRKYLKDL